MELGFDALEDALTDDRLRWKYAIISRSSTEITEDLLNGYGQFGWEIASTSVNLVSDKWGNTSFHTTIIFKLPYCLPQKEINGNS